MKKSIAMLLAIVMAFSLLPISAFAVETGGKIEFTTDFTTDLGVGDKFTVTAKLSDNPGIASFTNTLEWDNDVVKFTGFERKTTGNKKPISEVFADDSITASDTTGGFAVALDYNNDISGVLYTANFEIIGEEGELGLGLKTTEFGREFSFADVDGNDIMPALDFSAITGLTVGGKAVGAEIPEALVELGVSAITANNGGTVTAIEYINELEYDSYGMGGGGTLSPHYQVTVTPDVTEIYVTFPEAHFVKQSGPDDEDWVGAAYANANNTLEGGMAGLTYVEMDNGTIVNIPVEFAGVDFADWVVVPQSALKSEDSDYFAVGPKYEGEDAAIVLFSIAYEGESGEEEEIYSITIDENMVGGTLTAYNEGREEITEAKAGDYVFVTITPAEGYSGNSYTINGELANDVVFQMPEEDVILSATFTATHTCSYTESVVDAKYLKENATCQSGAVYYKSCTCGKFATTAETFVSGDPVDCVYENGACKWCGTAEPVQNPGYRFATSADVSAENGGTAVVHVKITGHSDENVTGYNAYDVTLTFDSDKLELATDEDGNYIYSGAVESDNGSVTVEGNTIRIVGCGADKGFGTEIAALTFKTKGEGQANITIDKVQVSDKNESVKEDAPEATPKHDEDDTGADETPDVSVVIVPYSVIKPDFVSGNDKILHGESYTFFYTDTTNYTYSDLTVKVGGTEVTPTEENGVYTIEGVTGAIEITVTQTPNSYNVTKSTNVTGDDKATYGEDYIFTVTPSAEDMAIDTVKVTLADGTEVPYTINENGEYVIEGTDITGEFTITVTEKTKMTTVTFSGIEATEIEGGLTQTAEIGKAFTFTLIKEEGYDYTVKVGETELAESEESAGQYTIPGELVVKDGVQVVITKEDNTKPVVDVTEYISLDGKAMFLVTAKWKDKVLAYGEDTMFWSDKYTVTGETEAGAYCWLVLSTDEMNTVELVKAAAEAAIVEAAEGATATAVKYNYDINGTTKVDVNDAQLAYDMYNASYMEFSENLPMLKFLEADMETDAKLDTKDVAAIISYIVSGANA